MNLKLSANPHDIRIDDVQTMLAKVFWSPDITRAEIAKGISHSALAVGAYIEGPQQIGFLRVISDKVRFAYLLDVVVHETYRRQGIGQRMVRFALSHPDLQDVYHWLLITTDAQGVYEKCGFPGLKNPEKWMSIMSPRPARDNFSG